MKDEQSGELMLKAIAGAYEFGDNSPRFTPSNSPGVSSVVQDGEARIFNDILSVPNFKTGGSGHTRTELAAPIKIGSKIIGVLHIEADQADVFTELDLFTAQTLADHLAVAVENARLYEQAQELATMKERNRLARDLHDAVSQTLFSAILIAESAEDLGT